MQCASGEWASGAKEAIASLPPEHTQPMVPFFMVICSPIPAIAEERYKYGPLKISGSGNDARLPIATWFCAERHRHKLS